MILSASRRTDIPSYYSEWFFNRIKEGYVLVRNPMNYHQVSRINISPDVTDGIVFWTKNPSRMLERLDELNDYPYYFQFTLTPYGDDVEPGLPSKRSVIIPSFLELARRVGPKRVIWRYDPILINEKYTVERHMRYFEMLACILADSTEKCVISFVDQYRNISSAMRRLGVKEVSADEMHLIARHFSDTAGKHGMTVYACAEAENLEKWGVKKAHCIDPELLGELAGYTISAGKDKNQRAECGCAESIDIGAYNSCRNLCEYCYANHSLSGIERNIRLHDPKSPMLIGNVEEGDRIAERKVKKVGDGQMEMRWE